MNCFYREDEQGHHVIRRGLISTYNYHRLAKIIAIRKALSSAATLVISEKFINTREMKNIGLGGLKQS